MTSILASKPLQGGIFCVFAYAITVYIFFRCFVQDVFYIGCSQLLGTFLASEAAHPASEAIKSLCNMYKGVETKMYVQIPTNSKPTFKLKKILLEAICMASEAAELASEAIRNNVESVS